MSVCTIWNWLVVDSPAQDITTNRSMAERTPVKVAAQQVGLASAPVKRQQDRVLAQNSDSPSTNNEIDKDLQLQGITITQDSADKSLLTVKGFINNHSEQSQYVYYIVAKFIANDTAIKQTVIPVNIDLEPGQSKPFVHEISTDGVKSIVPARVKPLVVKYEYRRSESSSKSHARS
jgi:diacylglycerol kinase family enzyme